MRAERGISDASVGVNSEIVSSVTATELASLLSYARS